MPIHSMDTWQALHAFIHIRIQIIQPRSNVTVLKY